MSKVFVLDSSYKPLDPVHPGRARVLLKQGKASVYRRFPFTIILKIVVDQPQVEPLRIKLDPGSKTTGIAVVNDASGEVVFAANLEHQRKERPFLPRMNDGGLLGRLDDKGACGNKFPNDGLIPSGLKPYQLCQFGRLFLHAP